MSKQLALEAAVANAPQYGLQACDKMAPIITCVCALSAPTTYRVILRGADQHILVAFDRPNRSLVCKEGALTLPRLQVPNLTEQM